MRHRRLVLVLILAATIALAGCNGGPGGTTTTTGNGTNATVTDSPAPSGSNASGNVDYPPGVTEAGLTNQTALYAADWNALNESGYVAESWFNQSTAGQGSDITMYQRGRVTAGGRALTLTRDQHASAGNITTNVWQNETFGLTKVHETAPGNTAATRYRRRDDVAPLRGNPLTSGTASALVAAGDFTVSGVTGTGADTRITLTADSANESQVSRLRLNVTSYSGEIVVDRAGRIRSADVTMETGGRQSATFSFEYDLQRTGEVSVERPNWFETGLSQAPNVAVTAENVNGSYVRLTNEGPDPLESGWQVQLQTRFAPVTANLSTAVEPGETVYLSIPNGSRQLRVTRTVPNDTRALSGIRAVTVAEVSEVTGQTFTVTGTPLQSPAQRP